jgi:uncharacterized protein YdaU (DUF1376 family)
MNWFKLYIGDYQRDTAHLSVTEHGAYLLMLQHYYATEKPIPSGKALHRMLRAQEKAEREAIDSVAEQFWTVTDAGLVNTRSDAEIAKAKAQGDANARVARDREERKKAARNVHESFTNSSTNDQPNQTPDTRYQIPEEEKHTPVAAPTVAGRACLAMKRVGIAGNPGHPDLLALIAAGATEAEFAHAAQVAVDSGKGFAYALGVLKGQRRAAAELVATLHKGPMPEVETARDRAARERAEEIAPSVARRTTHTAEVINVATRRVG